MYRLLFVLAALTGMAACSSSAPVSDSANAKTPEIVLAKNTESDDDVVCRREKKTGSNFTIKRCVTKEQAEKEQAESQNALQNMQKSGPKVTD